MKRDDNDARIDKIKSAVETIHGCKAVHDSTELVVEMMDGIVVWEGLVEAFSIFAPPGQPKPQAKRCYGWSFDDGKEEQFVAVLELPPVKDARTAVQAYIASLGK